MGVDHILRSLWKAGIFKKEIRRAVRVWRGGNYATEQPHNSMQEGGPIINSRYYFQRMVRVYTTETIKPHLYINGML